MAKIISILGSTGSIGKNGLKVAQHLGLKVEALAAKSNIDLLELQIKQFSPKLVAVFDEKQALELKKRVSVKVVSGMEGVIEAASCEGVDFVLSAMTGAAGIQPTAAALALGKTVGLANKEVLVAAGPYIMNLSKENNAPLIPVDSEHSALFQCLKGFSPKDVRRLILTASGGPFFKSSKEELETISIKEALAHPTWSMGAKVTVDSSTLMNKGFELIEAHFLFDVPLEKIDVVIHPQSIIHSFVEFVDGSMLAQASEPNMIYPIQYAMTHPERRPTFLPPFDFLKHSSLQFFAPDLNKFRCLGLAYEALQRGGSAPCFLNAANEVLVHRFLSHEISWKEIGLKLEDLLSRHIVQPASNLATILEIDHEARKEAELA